MLRKDRERDAAFAWEVFQKAPYATLSLTDEVGKPYAIPISPVVDEAYHVVYFHCAGHGEKWELLAKNPPVCLSAVSYAAAIPNEFSMAYASAVLHGRAEVVTDEAEQVKAMLLLCTAYDPKGMGRFSEYMEKYATKSEQRQFYLCGWSKMIDEAVVNIFLKLGYSRNQIIFELYGNNN